MNYAEDQMCIKFFTKNENDLPKIETLRY